jgi:RNA polymerase sigma factor (sigma-70 family)
MWSHRDTPAVQASGKTSSGCLLLLAKAGNRDALNHLFALYLPRLHRWAHRRVPGWARNGVDTSDLVQETILHTIRNFDSFEPQREGALLGYLRRALIHRVRDQIRNEGRHPNCGDLDADYVDAGVSPLDATIERSDREQYAAGLKRLRAVDRDAIVGRIELGYSYEQLALALAKPSAEAARLSVRRALLTLAEKMRSA